jgi:hypothetical protein
MSLQIELKIQRGIREAENELVEKMEEAFESQRGNLEESQFRNLLQVALSTESPEVVKNFLRYQVGRDDKWGRGKDSLAEAIVSHIQGFLSEKAKSITTDATAPEKANDVHMDLIRRYLGYGSRHLTWINKGQSESEADSSKSNSSKSVSAESKPSSPKPYKSKPFRS